MNYFVIDLREYWGKEEGFFNVLDSNERAKANRFKFPDLRRNYILTHAILRFKMATYLQVQPAAIFYQYGPFGKPFLRSQEIYFNMSHSRDMALYGFSFDEEIGVDIEYIEPSVSIDDLPLSEFPLSEQKQIFVLPIEKQKEAFYRLWTRKEAYLKAIGRGLQDFSAILPTSSDWCFVQPFCTSEYISAIAYRDKKICNSFPNL